MNLKPVIILIILSGFFIKPYSIQAQDVGQKMNSKEIRILIDSLSDALNRIYIYPEKAQLMANTIKNNYKKGVYDNAKNRSELALQLYNDIQQTHKDGHFNINYNPIAAKHIETPLSDAQQKEEYQQDLKRAREDNFAFKKTEILPGNIGYIRWDMFYHFIGEAKPVLDGAFQFVSNCKALIIDMRYNHGGSPEMVLQTESYFFKERTHLNDIIYRPHDTLKRWADPSVTNFKLDMPVYVLTSRTTFSGAEDFAYGMQHTKRATIIGDTTGGGAHPVHTFSIGQGFIASIPLGCGPKGEDWEGVGIRPNIPVLSEQALAKAQFIALSDCFAQAEGMEKMKLLWQLNNIKATENTSPPNVVTLNKYVGNYSGGLNFYIKEGSLYCKNSRMGNQVVKLKPIAENLFVLDENIQVIFEKDDTGAFTHLQMLWSDGWADIQWKDSYTPAEPKTVNVPESILQKYTGIYVIDNLFANVIKKKDGYYLYVNGIYFKMYFTSETDYFNKELNNKKQFKMDAAGNVTGYTILVNGMQVSQKIKVLNPDTLTGNADLFNLIGWNLIENKNYLEAIKYLKRGLQLYPTNLAIEENLAHCYLLKNEYNTAIAIYKKNLLKMIDLNNSWAMMVYQDFEFFKTQKFPMKEIDKAAAELNLKLHIAREKEEKNKRIQDWTLNIKRAETAKNSDPCILTSYSGTYEGGLDFYIKNGHLCCKNAERGKAIFELKYIENNLFILDENVQVEFIKDDAGVYSKIKFYWKTGDLSEKSKI